MYAIAFGMMSSSTAVTAALPNRAYRSAAESPAPNPRYTSATAARGCPAGKSPKRNTAEIKTAAEAQSFRKNENSERSQVNG